MNDLIFARAQMAMSLAFHIIFAAIGIGMPLLMVIAEGLHLRSKDHLYLELSKAWARGTAVLFAIGAVSGTVLSFELGLLWPRFMRFAGGIIGLPFSLEGFAFFTEAIFLGIYLYGWGRVKSHIHWLAGLVIAISGFISGAFVLTANGWMNAPSGFDLVNGQPVNIDPIAAMLNPASLHEILHMNLAAYVATAFSVAGIHAFFLLRQPNHPLHRRALGIALTVACITIPLQGLSGDLSARRVAILQPAKLAAMEALYKTQQGAPLILGGLPDSNAMTVRYGIELPYLLSLLAFRQPEAVVTGLDAFRRDQWPNVSLVHWSFDIMVVCGLAMGGVALWAVWLWWRRRLPHSPAFLKAVVASAPLGFIAIETGWIVTEVGRQPWIIYNIMPTAEAVTPVRGIMFFLIFFTLLYLILSVILIFVLRRQFLATVQANSPS